LLTQSNPYASKMVFGKHGQPLPHSSGERSVSFLNRYDCKIGTNYFLILFIDSKLVHEL
jgi:hypothetical protein